MVFPISVDKEMCFYLTMKFVNNLYPRPPRKVLSIKIINQLYPAEIKINFLDFFFMWLTIVCVHNWTVHSNLEKKTNPVADLVGHSRVLVLVQKYKMEEVASVVELYSVWTLYNTNANKEGYKAVYTKLQKI